MTGESTPSGPSGDAVPWPVIRVRGRGWFGGRQTVRLRPDDVAVSSSRRAATHDTLTADPLLGDASATTVRRDGIRGIRTTRLGRFTAGKHWTRVAIDSDAGRLQFDVPRRELANVDAALAHYAAGGVPVRATQRLSAGEWLFLGTSLFAAAALIVGRAVGHWDIGLAIATSVMVLAGIVMMAAVIDAGRSPFRGAPVARRRRKSASRRRPFRSAPLGWLLKTVAVVYFLWVVVFVAFDIPTTDAVTWLTAAAAAGLWYVPGLILLILGYRLCLKSFDPRRHPDPRPPVLFLRAFSDDGKRTFQPKGLLGKVHGIFAYRDLWADSVSSVAWIIHPVKVVKLFLNAERHSSEELLAAAFRRCGPFVTIGRPGERLATAGADRMYVGDDEWQRVVDTYLASSQAVVLQPADTDGVHWEMQQVFAIKDRSRVLLSMIAFKDRPNDYENFRRWLADRYGFALRLDLPFQRIPDLIYFDRDGREHYQPVCYRSPLLWSVTGNAIDVRRTFHSFIQGLGGRDREPPRQPRRHAGHPALSVVAVAAALAAFILASPLFLPQARYSTAVAASVLRQQAVEAAGPLVKLRTPLTRHATRVPFEFTLNDDWRPAAASGVTEFVFERGPFEKLAVDTLANVRTANVYDADWPGAFVKSIARQIETLSPGAVVDMRDARWVAINGTQWRQIDLRQSYANGLSEAKRIYYHADSSVGDVCVSYVGPDQQHFATEIESVAQSFRVGRSKLDSVLAAAATAGPVRYRGRLLDFEVIASSAWKSRNIDQILRDMGGVGDALRPAATGVEYVFALDGPAQTANLTIEVNEGNIDFDRLDELASETFKTNDQAMRLMFAQSDDPDMRKITVTSRVIGTRRLSIDGRPWAEFTGQTETSSPGGPTIRQSTIYRFTEIDGKLLVASSQITIDHPAVRELVAAIMDSFRIAASRPLATTPGMPR